ncbi:4'-demethylrebeccamycin synthase [Echria macrotheca]|uniref:4'-demethylrebeccamycin synthase n=1 Tax=Echria macrotheca TaxID=438768 RepID=A0AAJ0B3Q7_9PEZI|nr:4'-demethylrebeccamycin synthase [Echria macrotheca]
MKTSSFAATSAIASPQTHFIMAPESQKPVIVAASYPLPGHSDGPIQVAGHLARSGYKVYYVSNQDFKQKIEGAGCIFVEAPWKITLDDLPERNDIPPNMRMMWDLKHIFADSIPTHFQALKDTLERVHDENPGRKIIIFQELTHCGILPFVYGAPLPRGFDKLPPTITMTTTNNIYPDEGVPPFGLNVPYDPTPENLAMWRTVRKSLEPVNADLAGYFNKLIKSVGATRDMTEAVWSVAPTVGDVTLFPTTTSTDYPRSSPQKRFRYIGGLPLKPLDASYVYPEWWPLITANAALPESQRKKVVFVTQGTLSPIFTELLVPAIRALADREDLIVIVTLGARGATLDPAELGIPIPANTRVIDYLPYDALLPYTDVFFTNAGYNSFMHGIMNGVPMLVAGKDADKPEVAFRAEYCGVAVNLRTGDPTEAQIREGVDKVLGEPKYKQRALELQKENVEMDSLRQVELVIEELAA